MTPLTEGKSGKDPDAITLIDGWYVGADLGKIHDATVIVLLEVKDGIIWVRGIKDYGPIEFEVMRSEMSHFMDTWNCRHAVIDAQGIGHETGDKMEKKYGRARISARRFGDKDKAEMFGWAKAVFSDNLIRIPRKYYYLYQQFQTIVQQMSPAGNLLFRESERHYDVPWAFLYALWGVRSSFAPKVLGFESEHGERVRRTELTPLERVYEDIGAITEEEHKRRIERKKK